LPFLPPLSKNQELLITLKIPLPFSNVVDISRTIVLIRDTNMIYCTGYKIWTRIWDRDRRYRYGLGLWDISLIE